MNHAYPSNPWSQPLITIPAPNVKVSGSPLGIDESNSDPSSCSVPCKTINQLKIRYLKVYTHPKKAKLGMVSVLTFN